MVTRRLLSVAFALFAALASACLSAPERPYPCAQDGSCPNGDVCAEDVGCIQPDDCNAGSACTGSGDRCALFHTPFGLYLTACVAPAASPAGDGAPCTRGSAGIDDCGNGATCDAMLGSDGVATCKKLCASAGECGTNEACIPIDASHSVCAPTCELGTCGDGRSCRPLTGRFEAPLVCQADGDAHAYEPCDEATRCASGLFCSLENVCQATCDTRHPCASGLTCTGHLGQPGFCSCTLFSAACGSGNTCRFGDPVAPTCSKIGDSVTLGRCASNADCPANAVCLEAPSKDQECFALCDGTHPCAASSGLSCSQSVLTVTNDPSSTLGACYD